MHELAASSSNESRQLSDYVFSGLDVNVKDNSDKTALFYAVKDGSIDNLRKLIDLGANVSETDNSGESLLHAASESNRSDVKEKIELLLDKGLSVNSKDSNGQTPLMEAAYHGNLSSLETFIEKGAELNLKDSAGKNALDLAVENKSSSTAEKLINTGIDFNTTVDNQSILPRAAANDLGYVITVLVDKGMSVNLRDSDGETPLFKAAESNSPSALSALIEKKADVNAEDNNGETPLYEVNGEDNMKALLNAGADPQKVIKNKGKMVMHYMIDNNSTELEIIENYSPSALKYRDSNGETLLHYAAENNQADMFKLVWEKSGMNLTETDNNGDTPLHEAAYRGNDSVLNRILEIVNDKFPFSRNDILNIRNNQSKTAAELAETQGYSGTASLLR